MTDNKRKLKVKFAGRWRDEIQCRTTKVKVTTPPHHVRENIKSLQEKVRDLENILEVLDAADIKEVRPCIGELLYMNSPSRPREGAWLDRLSQGERDTYQKWADNFLKSVIDERYLTERLIPVRNYEDAAERRNRAVQAAREILERR